MYAIVILCYQHSDKLLFGPAVKPSATAEGEGRIKVIFTPTDVQVTIRALNRVSPLYPPILLKERIPTMCVFVCVFVCLCVCPSVTCSLIIHSSFIPHLIIDHSFIIHSCSFIIYASFIPHSFIVHLLFVHHSFITYSFIVHHSFTVKSLLQIARSMLRQS